MPEIDAKVARLIDEYRVALNAGAEQGVRQGAGVTLWRFVQVKDPDTKEILGEVGVDALRLRVEDVHPRFCVARVASETNFLVNWGLPRKKIQGAPNEIENAVRVNVGDAVTITVPSKEAVQDEL
jgi:hypothetical protein